MFETVVLALDGSEQADAAVPVATELARQANGRIVVAHIDERSPAKGDMVPKHPDEDELVAKVKGQVDAIAADGVETSLESDGVVLGGPAPKIAEIARAAGADVIVVGSHGHSALAGVVVGSVAHKLLHIAPCPVLVVPAA